MSFLIVVLVRCIIIIVWICRLRGNYFPCIVTPQFLHRNPQLLREERDTWILNDPIVPSDLDCVKFQNNTDLHKINAFEPAAPSFINLYIYPRCVYFTVHSALLNNAVSIIWQISFLFYIYFESIYLAYRYDFPYRDEYETWERINVNSFAWTIPRRLSLHTRNSIEFKHITNRYGTWKKD